MLLDCACACGGRSVCVQQVGELVKHTPAALAEERQLMEALLARIKEKCSAIDAAIGS